MKIYHRRAQYVKGSPMSRKQLRDHMRWAFMAARAHVARRLLEGKIVGPPGPRPPCPKPPWRTQEEWDEYLEVKEGR